MPDDIISSCSACSEKPEPPEKPVKENVDFYFCLSLGSILGVFLSFLFCFFFFSLALIFKHKLSDRMQELVVFFSFIVGSGLGIFSIIFLSNWGKDQKYKEKIKKFEKKAY
ncbi:hypothetical protein ACFL35_01440 [Candidatus Riflebacteria bacterium]